MTPSVTYSYCHAFITLAVFLSSDSKVFMGLFIISCFE